MRYALVDCNNFFVSCERAFQPELEGRPVVVLSNNDGCVVARSNESKAMGIKMGTPFFQVKELVDAGRLEVRSSNYALYGDLSDRVMHLLADTAPRIEIYSIDEAFMLLEGIEEQQVNPLCSDLVHRVRQWVGIPVSVGIAQTKTLAKVANHFAKKYPGYKGVCRIETPRQREKALSLTPVDDVWGIGWRMGPKLKGMGIQTALDFAQRPLEWVHKLMGITGVRTWKELHGEAAVQEESTQRKQSICTSRSFADMTGDLEELSLKVSDFAAMCARKLRQENSAAYAVTTFLYTNRFREDLDQYYPSATIRLPVPASSAQEIVGAALKALRTIYRPSFLYKKAGVIVHDTVAADAIQGALFEYDDAARIRNDKLSALMDSINTEGRNLLRLATQRPGHYADGIRREHCSKLYSTAWSDILEIH
ncbi:MAG: Y-family DNA polymerase [Bacteroidales bacterium]|nr:Y-family DNA polymerase [Bacteroidales bacterium]